MSLDKKSTRYKKATTRFSIHTTWTYKWSIKYSIFSISEPRELYFRIHSNKWLEFEISFTLWSILSLLLCPGDMPSLLELLFAALLDPDWVTLLLDPWGLLFSLRAILLSFVCVDSWRFVLRLLLAKESSLCLDLLEDGGKEERLENFLNFLPNRSLSSSCKSAWSCFRFKVIRWADAFYMINSFQLLAKCGMYVLSIRKYKVSTLTSLMLLTICSQLILSLFVIPCK